MRFCQPAWLWLGRLEVQGTLAAERWLIGANSTAESKFLPAHVALLLSCCLVLVCPALFRDVARVARLGIRKKFNVLMVCASVQTATLRSMLGCCRLTPGRLPWLTRPTSSARMYGRCGRRDKQQQQQQHTSVNIKGQFWHVACTSVP
jgi:hypothetical protein